VSGHEYSLLNADENNPANRVLKRATKFARATKIYDRRTVAKKNKAESKKG